MASNVRVWASELDPNALLQAERTGRLPILAGPVALMPDAHVGIGATVGSVVATVGAIIPAAVGVDLGCGMVAAELDLAAAELPDSLGPFMDDVRQAAPAGVGVGTEQASRARWEANRWLEQHPADLAQGDMATAANQLGTLGSGNHFVEVCLDERDRAWLVLHSGSRGVGNRLASRHIAVARQLATGKHLEDPDLAWLTQGTPEFQAYVIDMLWSQDYALASRAIMLAELERRFLAFVGHGHVVRRVNCHHNFAQEELHGGRLVWVTRKGAISAAAGEAGIIPGSMGTLSYVVRGRGNELAYRSSPHGAGRRLSRGQARRELTVESFQAHMAGVSVWQDRDAGALLDEHPLAYKSIDQVMADSADLVTVEHELRQVLNYKGVDEPRGRKHRRVDRV